MKKLLSLLLSSTMILSLVACGSASQASSYIPAQSQSTTSTSAQSTKPTQVKSANKSSKTLVVYFSMPETTKANNLTTEEENSIVIIDGKVMGNTQYVASIIEKNTGADLFRIEAKTPYTTDHEALVGQAKKEQNNSARTNLKKSIENLDIKAINKFSRRKLDIH